MDDTYEWRVVVGRARRHCHTFGYYSLETGREATESSCRCTRVSTYACARELHHRNLSWYGSLACMQIEVTYIEAGLPGPLPSYLEINLGLNIRRLPHGETIRDLAA